MNISTASHSSPKAVIKKTHIDKPPLKPVLTKYLKPTWNYKMENKTGKKTEMEYIKTPEFNPQNKVNHLTFSTNKPKVKKLHQTVLEGLLSKVITL